MERISPMDDYEPYVNTTTRSNYGCLQLLIGPAIFAVFVFVVVWVYQFRMENRLREPDQFVISYFDTLNRRAYADAWDYLSGDYRVNKHPTGFKTYSESWRPFTTIEVLRVTALEETELTANVDVFLALTKLDGSVVNQSSLYRLTRPTVSEPWKITDSSP